VNAGAGNVTFTGAIGSITPLAALVINTTSNTNLTGNVTASDSINFNSPATITNNILLTSNSINWTENVSGTGNLTLQPLTPGAPIVIGGIPGSGLNLTPTQLGLLQPSLGSVTIQTNSGGDISVNSPITLNPPTTLQTSPDTITINSPITGKNNASITLSAPTTSLNADISTSNQNITINGNTLLGNNVTLNTGSSGNITLNGAIDGNNNLTATAGTGNITFSGEVGGKTPLGNINANSTATTTFNAVNSASVTTTAGGKTQLNGDVSTTGSQTYSDAVTIAKDAMLWGSDITFNDAVDGSSNLTAKADSGNLTFNGPVGNATNGLGNLTANSTGTTAFNQTVNAASLTTDAGGKTQLNGDVKTTGSQTYSDAVTIAKDAMLWAVTLLSTML
jgi:hypothetical protein